MAIKLLEQETLDLIDIIGVLGERQFPLPPSITDYLEEIKKRKELEEAKRKEQESLKEFENGRSAEIVEPLPNLEQPALIQKQIETV
jgi:hypothetical protein